MDGVLLSNTMQRFALARQDPPIHSLTLEACNYGANARKENVEDEHHEAPALRLHLWHLLTAAPIPSRRQKRSAYVHPNVCMYACMYVRMCKSVCGCVGVFVYAWAWACACVCVRVGVFFFLKV